jgi:hypothetical protein
MKLICCPDLLRSSAYGANPRHKRDVFGRAFDSSSHFWLILIKVGGNPASGISKYVLSVRDIMPYMNSDPRSTPRRANGHVTTIKISGYRLSYLDLHLPSMSEVIPTMPVKRRIRGTACHFEDYEFAYGMSDRCRAGFKMCVSFGQIKTTCSKWWRMFLGSQPRSAPVFIKRSTLLP